MQIDHVAYPKALRNKSEHSLRYIMTDAAAAIRAMPDGPKAGYYQDEINYCSMELFHRLGKTKVKE